MALFVVYFVTGFVRACLLLHAGPQDCRTFDEHIRKAGGGYHAIREWENESVHLTKEMGWAWARKWGEEAAVIHLEILRM